VNDETPIYDDLVAALHENAGRPSPTEWPAYDPDPGNAATAVSASGKHVASPFPSARQGTRDQPAVLT
jgi:hypothetical protein